MQGGFAQNSPPLFLKHTFFLNQGRRKRDLFSIFLRFYGNRSQIWVELVLRMRRASSAHAQWKTLPAEHYSWRRWVNSSYFSLWWTLSFSFFLLRRGKRVFCGYKVITGPFQVFSKEYAILLGQGVSYQSIYIIHVTLIVLK